MTRPKLLIAETKDFDQEALEILNTFSDVTQQNISPNEIAECLETYDIVWFRLKFELNSQTLSNKTRCKIIVTPVTGLDHIDEALCKKFNIEIISLRGESEFLKNVRATAELTIALTLLLMRNITTASKSVEKGEWERDKFRGNEIYGKTVGILGVGRLGSIVAEYFKAFGANVIGYDIDKENLENVTYVDSLRKLIEGSDILTIHVNYNENTRNLIGEEEFKWFKKECYLINTSRGGVVDEDYLLDALSTNKIKGAAVDVVQNERMFDDNNKLLQYSLNNTNLVITPHIGGNTYESFKKTEVFLANKLASKVKELFN